MTVIPVHESDLAKIADVLRAAADHHARRDESNAELHLAREVRYSPLTSELRAMCERVAGLMKAADDEEDV